MPKVVDHQERRLVIADALMRVESEHGLDEISLRHVAAAAGVSTGMVQHYFRTKAEMMLFVLSVVRSRAQERMTAAVALLGPASTPRELLRTVMLEMLALDEARQADTRVGLMFTAYAAVRPEVGALLHEDFAHTRAFLAAQIRAARADVPSAAEAGPAHDPDLAAVGLLALAEGMNQYLLGDHYDAATATAALDAHLDLIVGRVRR